MIVADDARDEDGNEYELNDGYYVNPSPLPWHHLKYALLSFVAADVVAVVVPEVKLMIVLNFHHRLDLYLIHQMTQLMLLQ